MRYDITPSATSRETKLVEEAEVEILKIAKEAAETMQTQGVYLRRVANIVKALNKQLTNEDLKKKCAEVLPRYALRVYGRQRQLIEAYAEWYIYALLANQKNVRGAKKAFESINKSISPELRKTRLFKYTTENIPDEAFNWSVPLSQYQRSYIKTVRELTVELVAGDAKDDYASNVNLRNIAEMTVRYEHQISMIRELEDKGVRLVWIEPHANCSKRCEKYQVGGTMHPSGLYSLDGTTGYQDGIFYRPLEFATKNPADAYVTRRGVFYQNGCITGFNCRHRLVPYKKGNRPTEIPSAVIERRRSIEEMQRRYERAIREKRREAVIYKSVAPVTAKRAEANARKLLEKYEEYSRKNNAPFYRERTRIFENADNL